MTSLVPAWDVLGTHDAELMSPTPASAEQRSTCDMGAEIVKPSSRYHHLIQSSPVTAAATREA